MTYHLDRMIFVFVSSQQSPNVARYDPDIFANNAKLNKDLVEWQVHVYLVSKGEL